MRSGACGKTHVMLPFGLNGRLPDGTYHTPKRAASDNFQACIRPARPLCSLARTLHRGRWYGSPLAGWSVATGGQAVSVPRGRRPGLFGVRAFRVLRRGGQAGTVSRAARDAGGTTSRHTTRPTARYDSRAKRSTTCAPRTSVSSWPAQTRAMQQRAGHAHSHPAADRAWQVAQKAATDTPAEGTLHA
jgi:hypothetical protein